MTLIVSDASQSNQSFFSAFNGNSFFTLCKIWSVSLKEDIMASLSGSRNDFFFQQYLRHQ